MADASLLGNGSAPAWLGGALRVLCDQLARRHGQARRLLAARPGSTKLLQWGRKYLPHHFTRPPSILHRWLGEYLDKMSYTRGMKLNVLGPRGGAKSTIGTLAFVLRAAVEGCEPYIWIVSDTRHQACAHLENVKAELLDNPRLAADYAGAAGRSGGPARSCSATESASRPSAPASGSAGGAAAPTGPRSSSATTSRTTATCSRPSSGSTLARGLTAR